MAYLLRPSFAPIWAYCSGAVAASACVPNVDSESTMNGTAAHWCAAATLESLRDTGPITCMDFIGQTAPNGVVIDEEIARGAQTYVADILEVVEEYGTLHDLRIEHEMHIKSIHEQNGGTMDCGAVFMAKGRIFIWDYKHGHGKVDAWENWQLIDYLAGIVQECRINGYDDQFYTVHFRIVQPYCYQKDGPVEEKTCRLSDLRGHFNHLRHQANEAMTAPTLTAGKHCRYCPRLQDCTTATRAIYDFVDYVKQPLDFSTMSAAELAVERDILNTGKTLVSARLDAVEEDLHQKVAAGDRSANLALTTKTGRLKWTRPFDEVVGLGMLFNLDLRKRETCTPTQALDMLPPDKRAIFETQLKQFAKKDPTGLKLVNADNTLGARAFSKKEN